MQSRNSSSGSLPGWVLPVAIIVGVLVVGLAGWKAFTGSSAAAPGKAVEVRPGMIDYRQEMQKPRQPSPLGDALH
jgi:hypothetical protein